MDSLSLGKFPIEYVKSAPYLLSFMNYRVKDKIVDALEKQGDYRLVEQKPQACCCVESNQSLRKDPCNNGRLQTLFNEAFSRERNGAELLLWIPASRPYYSTKKCVFDKNKGYSKTLVFSSWGDGSPHDCRTYHMRRAAYRRQARKPRRCQTNAIFCPGQF